MITELSRFLTWHELAEGQANAPLPENAERILLYIPALHWFTMATFVNDDEGMCFVCHCTVETGRPLPGKLLDVGETRLCWARLSPSVARASWYNDLSENNQ